MDQQEAGITAAGQIDRAVSCFLSALSAREDVPEIKLAVADLLRLLDLRRQLSYNEIREVKARWVESDPDSFVSN